MLANSDRFTPRFGFMQRLLEDIARLRDEGFEVVLCSSGAVALGLNTVGVRPEDAGVTDKQAAAASGITASSERKSFGVTCPPVALKMASSVCHSGRRWPFMQRVTVETDTPSCSDSAMTSRTVVCGVITTGSRNRPDS